MMSMWWKLPACVRTTTVAAVALAGVGVGGNRIDGWLRIVLLTLAAFYALADGEPSDDDTLPPIGGAA